MEYILDESGIAGEEKYNSYYTVTANLSDPAKDMLDISRKRYQIEDRFGTMEASFGGRPVNHRLPERAKAHFLICFTALPVHHLMEVKLDEQGTHVTVNDSITTLRNMNVADIHDIEYMALCDRSKALDALTQLTLLPLGRIHYRPKKLNGIVKRF